jgi:hypothetical protein
MSAERCILIQKYAPSKFMVSSEHFFIIPTSLMTKYQHRPVPNTPCGTKIRAQQSDHCSIFTAEILNKFEELC